MSPLGAITIPPETLSRARLREAAALEVIYRACFPAVRALVQRLVTRSAVADEITQDVFVQVLRYIDGYSGHGPFGAWVRKIVVSKCLMYLRSPWNRAALWLEVKDGDDDGRTESAASRMAAESEVPIRSWREDAALEAALERLAPLSRTVVWLHDVEGYTHAEIARELGRSESFSKSQLARAHQRLRQWLADPEERVACTPAPTSY